MKHKLSPPFCLQRKKPQMWLGKCGSFCEMWLGKCDTVHALDVKTTYFSN